MGQMNLQIVKGMRDLVDQEVRVFAHLEEQARKVFGLYGYQELRTPILEMAELFVHAIGEETDIVGKEMYLLEDKKVGKLALRGLRRWCALSPSPRSSNTKNRPSIFTWARCSGTNGPKRVGSGSSTRSGWNVLATMEQTGTWNSF